MINQHRSNHLCFIYKIITRITFALLSIVSIVANAATEQSGTNSVISILNSDSQYQKAAPRFHLFRSLQTSAIKLTPVDIYPYFGAVAGIGTSYKIGAQQLDATQGIENGYWQYLPNTNSHYTTILCGINGGYEFKLNSKTMLALGLGVYQNLNYHSKGQVWYLYEPILNYDYSHQFDYEYKVLSTRIMLESQFSWIFCLNDTVLIPFISLGVGPSLNLANSYQEAAVDTQPTLPGFKAKSTISFAYQLGVGIAYPFNSNRSRISIAYRYVDLGGSHFNNRQDYSYQLDIGRIKANEVYIGYTHLFNF